MGEPIQHLVTAQHLHIRPASAAALQQRQRRRWQVSIDDQASTCISSAQHLLPWSTGREAQAAGVSTYSTRHHLTRHLIRGWTTLLKTNQIQFISTFVKRTISESFFANIVKIYSIQVE